ncbi:Harpin-induced protein [Rhynchospora pubera]|uniref:Harpin-induced protein n=2 Tax=Rhynchospora pubera TaxID=906938 RepID=A0AAV8C5M3_9POAL|nr:Harpin-induced protein [Rhynchospora pubera]
MFNDPFSSHSHGPLKILQYFRLNKCSIRFGLVLSPLPTPQYPLSPHLSPTERETVELHPPTLPNPKNLRQMTTRPYPPYQPPLRNPHYSSPSSSASIKGCCCCLFLLLTLLALLALAVALFVVLVVKPHKPSFDLNQVSVQYLLVTAPSASLASSTPVPTSSNPYLSLNITLLFTAVNPNKVGIRYGSTDFEVMYHGVPLGVAVVPGFEQPAHSSRVVRSTVSVDHFDVTQAGALDLVRDAAVNDRVELRITGDVGARILVLGLTSPRVQVSVDCVIVISPRKQSVTYKQCGVDGVNL